MHYIDRLNILPNTQQRFGNYFNSQSEILHLVNGNSKSDFLVISGKSGSGITHVLNAICNTYIGHNKKVLCINTQWLFHIEKLLKFDHDSDMFLESLMKFDVIAIDNLQLLYHKSNVRKQFMIDIINFAHINGKSIILGCSNPDRDFTKSKKLAQDFNFQRIELKELSTYDVFKALTNLCTPEDEIPEALLYAISGYNGMIQQHIQCLISIRFNPLLKAIKGKDLAIEDYERLFNIKSYFPKQQFRKCFYQMKFDFTGISLSKMSH
jgi:chromosomal replication initiation ATPase DnaA